MSTFQIQTAQNVAIRQNLAPLADRVVAYFLDLLILGIYYIVALFILIWAFEGNSDIETIYIFVTVIGIPLLTYHLLWETFDNGRTPGKRAMKLRVVKEDGSRAGFSSYLLRWILRLVDISFTSGGVALFLVGFTEKRQRLGDKAARTVVISTKKRVDLRQTLLVKLSEDHEPMYPQVSMLSDKDMQTVKTMYHQARARGENNVMNKLAMRVAELMQVEVPTYGSSKFVAQVLKDYTYYTQQ